MATQYAFGKIVTDGLVLALDAADRNSYPGSGATWKDLAPNINNGTLLNGPTFSNTNGGTLTFGGGNQYATFTNTSILSTTSYTKIAWFNPSSTANNNIISGDTGGQHAFWMGNTSYLQAGHNGSFSTISYPSFNLLNKWTMGAVTFNTTTGWVMYINGASVATNASTTTFLGTGIITVAGYGATSTFNGSISICQVYNRVLSPAEILQNYTAQKSRFGLT